MNNRSVGIHNGPFHADEVLACALLICFNLIDRQSIVRSRDSKVLKCCEFVCDVGGVYDEDNKRFDHHQATYRGPLSSAGMVLRYLLDRKIITSGQFALLNENLVKGVDAHDNGKSPALEGIATFSLIIDNFLPVQYDAEDDELDKCFYEALDFVLGHVSRMLKRYEYSQGCKEIVQRAMEEGELWLDFTQAIPWQDNFFELGGENHPAQFVVMPARGRWKVRGIPPNPRDPMGVRCRQPRSWAGLSGKALFEVSGMPGGVFCHKECFVSIWESHEAAISALKHILNVQ